MKAIYFGDIFGEVEKEKDEIQSKLAKEGIDLKIISTDLPPWEKQFDILFFDWGGMSAGNDMLGHFCRDILHKAENSPGKIFIMTSRMTGLAMEDAMHALNPVPENIYLSVESAIPVLKAVTK